MANVIEVQNADEDIQCTLFTQFQVYLVSALNYSPEAARDKAREFMRKYYLPAAR